MPSFKVMDQDEPVTEKCIHELLVARKLISSPERWTKGFFAKDDKGVPVGFNDATCWCIRGALMHVMCVPTGFSSGILEEAACDVLRKSQKKLYLLRCDCVSGYSLSLTHFNDSILTKHADILALFDDAIEQTKDVK